MKLFTQVQGYYDLFMKIAQRLPVTLEIMVLSMVISMLLGILIAVVRIRRKPVSFAIATFYLSFMRCTPILIQLFLVYYGLPQLLLLFNIDTNNWNSIIFAVFTFSLNSSAFLSEVVRSAYLSVGSGQQEAAFSVGMTYFQTIRRIILPQACVIALPNLGNNLIILLKETSLAFTIGITDIMGQVSIITGNNYGTNIFEVYIVISLIYWIICLIIERSTGQIEKQLGKAHTGIIQYKR